MDKLPPELIHNIGHWLDGSSLVSSLQVSYQWHHNFLPLVWKDIKMSTWHCAKFPFHEEHLLTLMSSNSDNNALEQQFSSRLAHVRQLQWCDMIPYKNRKEKRKQSLLTIETIERLVGLTSNLVVLNLVIKYRVVLDSLPTLPQTLNQLTSLRELTLIWIMDLEILVVIEDLFPLFSRLIQLRMSGKWVTTEKDYEEGVDEQSWSIRRMTINSRHVSLARHCPALVALTVSHSKHILEHQDWGQHLLRPLLRCQQLKRLELPEVFNPHLTLDPLAHLPLKLLKSLERLFFPVKDPLDIEWLNENSIISRNNDSDADDANMAMVLPKLLALYITWVSFTETSPLYPQLMQAIKRFLMTRTRLIVLGLTSIEIDPKIVFAQPGKELEHSWACLNLHTVHLKLSNLNVSRESVEQHRSVMSCVYRQLGCLPRLYMLTIRCSSKQVHHFPGIKQLKSAKNLKIVDLEGIRHWTREGIEVLLSEAVPGLVKLALTLNKEQKRVIEGWISRTGRSNVVLEGVDDIYA